MASSSTENKEKIVLTSSDGEKFEMEKAAALLSRTVTNMIDDDCTDGGIPLPNVHSKTMAKVLEFCNHHAAEAAKLSGNGDDSKKNFDTEFVDSVKDNQELLFDLILAANYLDIRKLLDLLCGAVAGMMKGKTPEQIRKHFHIKNDFSPEEQEEVRRENAWAFE